MNPGENTGIFRPNTRVCKGQKMGMHGLHTVDKSQNRNNSNPQTVDNFVDGVDRYASIHSIGGGMNMQYAKNRRPRTPRPPFCMREPGGCALAVADLFPQGDIREGPA